jgi:hypothetical protein
MPAPVGTQRRVIVWRVPGVEGVNIKKYRLQKSATVDGAYFDLPGMPAEILDANANFIEGFEDPESDDTFFYRIAFIEADGRQSIFSEPGEPGLFNLKHALLFRLRLRLGDDDPSRYQLDNNLLYKWDQLKVSVFLDEALLEFNAHAPTQTNYQFETAPADLINIILYSAEAKCLRERARLELANKLTYSDGISITIDRSAEYGRQADIAMEEFHKMAYAWKNINRARARGLAYQRLPFKVLRPLSFGPNAVNLFST